MLRIHNKSGFTLIELLTVIAILGIIVGSLTGVIEAALSSHRVTQDGQNMLSNARRAMNLMATYVRETDSIVNPDAPDQEILQVSERVLDTYDNTTQSYMIDGDGFLDADNDSDGIVNEDATTPDPPEYITFDLDKTDADNWKLRVQIPDYSTAALGDFLPVKVISEHVTSFTCNLLGTKLLEIALVLRDEESVVSLKTRVIAENI